MCSIYKQLCLFLVVVLLMACDNGFAVTSAEYTGRAETHIENEQYDEALIELKNALLKDPENAHARLLLGQLYLKYADGKSAQKEFVNAIRTGVPSVEIQPFLARAKLLQQEYEAVANMAQLPGMAEEDAAELHALRGAALFYLKEYQKADAEFSSALSINADSVNALLGKAKMSMLRGNDEEARAWIGRALELNDSFAEAWHLLGNLESSLGNYAEAINAYTSASENRLIDHNDRVKRALLYIKTDQLDKAEADLRYLRSQVSESPVLDYAEGVYRFRQGQYADAQSAFYSLLAVESEYYDSGLYYAGASHYMLQNWESAQDYLLRFIVKKPDNKAARKMVAMINLNNGDYNEAEQLIRPVVEKNPDDADALGILASALSKKNASASLDYMHKITMLEPDSAQAHVNLGIGLLKDGQIESAKSELEKAKQIGIRGEKQWVQIVLTQLKAKSYKEALDSALGYVQEFPASVDAHILLASVYMDTGDKNNASMVFQKVLELDPGNTSANSGLAAIAAQSGQFDKARQHYIDALDKHPGHLKTLRNLAALEAARGNMEGMVSVLQQAVETNPESLPPRMTLARYYAKNGEPAKAVNILSPVRITHENNPMYLALLGESELAVKDYEQAMADLKRLVKLAPNDAQAHYLLAQAYGQQQNSAEYQPLYRVELETAVELNPNHFDARLALAKYLLSNEMLDEAERHIKMLSKQSDGSDKVLLLDAQLKERKGDMQGALDAYTHLFDKKSNNYNLLLLESALWEVGKAEESVRHLETWVSEHPNDQLALQQLGNRYISLNNARQAIEVYERILKIASDNIVALNNMAWLLKNTDVEKAIDYAEQAYVLAPGIPSVNDTLAMLISKQDPARAKSLIESAITISSGEPIYVYHKAVILHETGNTEEAVRILRLLLSQKYEDFPEYDSAFNMLNKLSGD